MCLFPLRRGVVGTTKASENRFSGSNVGLAEPSQIQLYFLSLFGPKIEVLDWMEKCFAQTYCQQTYLSDKLNQLFKAVGFASKLSSEHEEALCQVQRAAAAA